MAEEARWRRRLGGGSEEISRRHGGGQRHPAVKVVLEVQPRHKLLELLLFLGADASLLLLG